jgi:hypothetical protein
LNARRLSTLGGALVAAVVGLCVLAWRDDTGLVPRDGGLAEQRAERVFLVLLIVAFLLYVAGLLTLRAGGPFRVAATVAVVVQLAPLAAPLLLSTDAWTYWGYGWIGAQGEGNPYEEAPEEFPQSPAASYLGASWRDTTTVYGPVFTLASEGVSLAAGGSPDLAAWIFKALAGAAAVAAALLAARVSRRPALAVAAVGWNPLLAVHLAGGGHNDAWLGALLMAALALGAAGHVRAEGSLWATAVAVKWIPLVLLPLRLLERRAAGLSLGLGAFAATLALLGVAATAFYGAAWLGAAGPLVSNAALRTSYALPSRLADLGVPDRLAIGLAICGFLGGYLVLARLALRGRATLGLAACLLLATTPYLAVWYLGWAVPLAAADDESELPLLLVVAFSAYLLPQAIPR